MSPGFVIARDLGDGTVEMWEQTGGGTVPVRVSAGECLEELRRYGADLDEWRVYALVDTTGGDPA